MEHNSTEPIAELIEKLGEIKNIPLGPERDQKFKEAQELFAPAAEELSLLGDTIGVLAERNQNGESLKSFMQKAGVDTPGIRLVHSQSKSRTWFNSGLASLKGYWDRKKGKIAVGMALTAALFFMVNQRNIKMLHDFTHDEDLVGQFEDWLGLTNPEDWEDRETPLNWKELRDSEGESDNDI